MKGNFLKKLNYIINIGINSIMHGVLGISNLVVVMVSSRITVKRS